MPVHFSTRCLVRVREPACESIKIVSLATKKVNERPAVVLPEPSVRVGLPPERTNFWSLGGVFGLVGHASAIPLPDHRATLSQDAGQLPGAGGTCPRRLGVVRRRDLRPPDSSRDPETRPESAIRASPAAKSRGRRPRAALCFGRSNMSVRARGLATKLALTRCPGPCPTHCRLRHWPQRRSRSLREDGDDVSGRLHFLFVAPHSDLVSLEDGFALPEPRMTRIHDVSRGCGARERIGRNVSRARTQVHGVGLPRKACKWKRRRLGRR